MKPGLFISVPKSIYRNSPQTTQTFHPYACGEFLPSKDYASFDNASLMRLIASTIFSSLVA